MLYSQETTTLIQKTITKFYQEHPLAITIAKVKQYIQVPINPLNPFYHPAPGQSLYGADFIDGRTHQIVPGYPIQGSNGSAEMHNNCHCGCGGPPHPQVKILPVSVNDVLGILSKDGINDDAFPTYAKSNPEFVVEVIKSVQKQRIRDLEIPTPDDLIDLGW
jgi:hypothetical protein